MKRFCKLYPLFLTIALSGCAVSGNGESGAPVSSIQTDTGITDEVLNLSETVSTSSDEQTVASEDVSAETDINTGKAVITESTLNVNNPVVEVTTDEAENNSADSSTQLYSNYYIDSHVIPGQIMVNEGLIAYDEMYSGGYPDYYCGRYFDDDFDEHVQKMVVLLNPDTEENRQKVAEETRNTELAFKQGNYSYNRLMEFYNECIEERNELSMQYNPKRKFDGWSEDTPDVLKGLYYMINQERNGIDAYVSYRVENPKEQLEQLFGEKEYITVVTYEGLTLDDPRFAPDLWVK